MTEIEQFWIEVSNVLDMPIYAIEDNAAYFEGEGMTYYVSEHLARKFLQACTKNRKTPDFPILMC